MRLSLSLSWVYGDILSIMRSLASVWIIPQIVVACYILMESDTRIEHELPVATGNGHRIKGSG